MYLTGGQAKLDRNKNNKIDAQDFAILRKEKAKGRGKGLQDEKMKPGKVKPVKAVLGLAAMGVLGAKFLKDKKKKASKMPGAAGAGIMPGETVAELYKKKMQGKVAGGAIGAMGSGLGKSARDRALKSVKSSIDIIAAANRDRGKDKARVKKKSKGGGADTGRAGELRSSMGVAVNQVRRMARKLRKFEQDRLTERDIKKVRDKKRVGGPVRTDSPMAEKKETQPKRPRTKPMTKPSGRPMTRAMMGGGMMMAPRGAMGAMGGGMATPMGYKKGKSVKVKCKLGRNKPTKMY